jgi:hypothetical protein
MPPISKKITFGMVREIPKDAEEKRVIPFILSTSTRDRHNTILNQGNWLLENYRKNPIVGYMHNLYGDMCNPPDPDDVIAKSPDIGVVEMAGVVSLQANPVFETADINLKSDKIFRKLLFGSLSAASVGFLEVGNGQYGMNDEAEGRDNETFYFAGQELLEWSVVNIPSNPDGVKRSMRDQTAAAIAYAHRALGGKFRLSQIEEMRVRDVLDLLDGKDIEIRETDPERVRMMLREVEARKAADEIIDEQIARFKTPFGAPRG